MTLSGGEFDLQDVIAFGLKVLFCGINPAASAARSGHHFSHRSNRFWRVLYLAGFTPCLIASDQDQAILQYGFGLTAAVRRPTVRAGELFAHEFQQQAGALEQKVLLFKPEVLAFLGKPAFAAIYRQRNVKWGKQSVTIGKTAVWVVPNPSGLNRSFPLDTLISSYRQLLEELNAP